VNAAAISRPTPSEVLPASVSTEWRRPGSSRLASPKSTMCAIRKTPYDRANSSAESSKASGTQSAATSRAAMAPKNAIRTAPSSGSITLVSQA
jgi:hypothetical protein